MRRLLLRSTRCLPPPLNAPLDPLPPPPPVADALSEVKTAEKVKRGRHVKGQPKARPGKLSWVHGTKLSFFARRKAEWLREADAGRSGSFYTKMAKLYVKKYGYHLADDQDLAVDIEDPPDSAANEVTHEVLTPAEADFRKTYMKNLRTRIGAWYRTEYGRLLKSDEAAFKELFTGILDGAPPTPQRPRMVHFYSRKFYDDRVKPYVEERLEALTRRAELSGEDLPRKIDVISKVTAERWEAETAGFKAECQVAMEREYEAALKAWESSLADSPTQTPEERAAALGNIAHYLVPFVEAIEQRFGMCASVMLAGPIGIRGGRIGVQSVHAGKTRGLAPVNWPDFDWAGFQAAEKSMISFAKECFTEAECLARAVDPKNIEQDTAMSTDETSPAPKDPLPPTSIPTATSSLSTSAISKTTPTPPVVTSPPVTAPPRATATPTAAPTPLTGEAAAGQEGRTGDDIDKGCADGGAASAYDDLWQCGDRAEWTDELRNAHAAFALGKEWGPEWAGCVQKYFDFESECGYTDGTWRMATKSRPHQVGGWITRGRKWTLPPCLPETLGTADDTNSWVGGWWAWWKSLQPNDRIAEEGGGLSRPATAYWKEVAKMYGKNGLLQVMATLVWWGEAAWREREGEPSVWNRWLLAVEDVKWVIEQVLESGDIERDESSGKKRKESGRGSSGESSDEERAARPSKKRKRVSEKRRAGAQRMDGEEVAGRTRSAASKSAAGTTRPTPKPRYRGKH
ncbi:hypothetical protein MSAN_00610300 [Mycena sanguinolenta]|uniref:Uncharacterized protein n=1 Tax=Mycena sanguinolenta TaxID=230812 RepID=A0A8H7DJW9_9AGAR|nr:hypothetical protein MSAN_00610300 [Mycena sanguinolenta]